MYPILLYLYLRENLYTEIIEQEEDLMAEAIEDEIDDNS
jgi:hypothetical protein